MKRIFAFTFALCLAFSFILNVCAMEELSIGCKYTLITPASPAYPDDGTKLTDGTYATLPDYALGYYASPDYVGFSAEDADDHGNYVIILDLGEVRKNITEITVGYLNERAYGIFAPESISYAISESRNSDYVTIGTVSTNPDIEGETAGPLSKSFLANNATGRYLKITITPGTFANPDTNSRQRAKWTFIDEISVRSQPEALKDTDTDITGNTPQTGDNSLRPVAYVLLAVSAVTMLASLFVGRKQNRY